MVLSHVTMDSGGVWYGSGPCACSEVIDDHAKIFDNGSFLAQKLDVEICI